MTRNRFKPLTAAGVILGVAIAAGTAGCQGPRHAQQVPAIFSPAVPGAPCPPGWHRDPSYPGSCLITGTLQPGQQLPLPVISGTPLQMPTPGTVLHPKGSPAPAAQVTR